MNDLKQLLFDTELNDIIICQSPNHIKMMELFITIGFKNVIGVYTEGNNNFYRSILKQQLIDNAFILSKKEALSNKVIQILIIINIYYIRVIIIIIMNH